MGNTVQLTKNGQPVFPVTDESLVMGLNKREYDSQDPNGLGYLVLEKDKTFAEQVTDTNTIYEIRYDYDLDGETVTIPAGCVLKFEGGKIFNGTLVGQKTRIDAADVLIFQTGIYKYRGYELDGSVYIATQVEEPNTILAGTWDNSYVSPSWIGLDTISEEDDSAHLINTFINLHREKATVVLPRRTYGIYGIIPITSRILDGNDSVLNICSFSDIYSGNIDLPAGATPLNSTYYPSGLPLRYQFVYCIGAGAELRNITIDESAVTTEDIDVTRNFGIYGLVGKQGSYDAAFKNVRILNALQNGFLGLAGGNVLFEGCEWDGSGEHEFYCRPENGSIVFRRCTFRSWENIQSIATARGEAYATKIEYAAGREDSCDIKYEDCRFEAIDGLGNYVVSTLCDNLHFTRCTFLGLMASHYANDANKVLNVYIDSCKGIPYDSSACGGIIHISNSEGPIGCLINAYEVDNCVLNTLYVSERDNRGSSDSSFRDTVRNLYVRNTIIRSADSENNQALFLTGAYNIVFDNVLFLPGKSNLGNYVYFNFKPNASNTAVTGITPKLELVNCNFSLGKRLASFLYAALFDVSLNRSIFSGERATSGYDSRLQVVREANSLSIIQSYCVPGADGTLLNLFNPTYVASVNWVAPVIVGTTSESSSGITTFDQTALRPKWYNGTTWVGADGLPIARKSGTTAQRPVLSSSDIGYQYFDTDLGKMMVWSGSAWGDPTPDAVKALTSGGKKIWTGTQAEYDLLTPSNDTLYFITSS